MQDTPLGLPTGSIRAIIALIVALLVGYSVIAGNIGGKELLGIASFVVGYYFGSRTGENK